MAKYVPTRSGFGHRPLDLFYYDLQLFVLGPDPLDQGGPYPTVLELARFAAPAVTLFAVAETSRLLLTAQLGRLRLRILRGHVVVSGDGLIAETLASRLAAAGKAVVLVGGGRREPSDPSNGWVRKVAGDIGDPGLLRNIGVAYAVELYTCGDDSAGNTVTALMAAKVRAGRDGSSRRRGGRPDHRLPTYVQISDPDLCAALHARRLGLAAESSLRLHFFSPDELGAEVLIADEIRNSSDVPPEHVAIVGMTGFGRAVLLEMVRWWRARERASGPQPLMTLIDPLASVHLRRLTRRYRFATDFCRFEIHDGDLADYLETVAPRLDADRIYICLDDDLLAFKLALTIGRLSRNTSQVIVVRQERLAAFGLAPRDEGENPLMDDFDGALRIFGVIDAVCDSAVMGQDLTDRLARSVHERYVRNRAARGETSEINPAMVPWAVLPESLRRASRRQVEGIGHKLRALGCVLILRDGPEAEFAFTPDEVETLAVMEHRRWADERSADGWTYAPLRDDVEKHHPDLREWDAISEDVRDKDRDAVREIPRLLQDVGFHIVRTGKGPDAGCESHGVPDDRCE